MYRGHRTRKILLKKANVVFMSDPNFGLSPHDDYDNLKVAKMLQELGPFQFGDKIEDDPNLEFRPMQKLPGTDIMYEG